MGTIGGLVPDPDGLMIAGVAFDYAGVFARIPTEDATRAWMFLSLARSLITADSEGEEKMEENQDAMLMRGLDVSQAPDGSALLISLILDGSGVDRMLLE